MDTHSPSQFRVYAVEYAVLRSPQLLTNGSAACLHALDYEIHHCIELQ
jgi:hypothetical protein